MVLQGLLATCSFRTRAYLSGASSLISGNRVVDNNKTCIICLIECDMTVTSPQSLQKHCFVQSHKFLVVALLLGSRPVQEILRLLHQMNSHQLQLAYYKLGYTVLELLHLGGISYTVANECVHLCLY